jgi:glycosyltransferase involved in cell wall biosynthesis
MNVLFITIGDNNVPSSRVRALQYIPYLEKEGIVCDHLQYRKGHYLKHQTYGTRTNLFNWFFAKLLTLIWKLYDYLIYSKLSILKIWISYSKYDLIFIQKVVLPGFLIKRMKLKCKIVFDFDDAIYTKSRLFTMKQFGYQIKQSDITIVTNEEAEQYVKRLGGNHVERIIGPIDSCRYQTQGGKLENNKFNIGWIGSQSNFHYLDIIKEPLRLLSAKYPGEICLHLVGVENVSLEDVETLTYIWDSGTEVQILDTFDVGIMPLKNDDFTRGKGGYKLLQYMSMSKANISSPVGVNSKIVNNGVSGFSANSEEEWFDCFEEYHHSKSLREKHGKNARKLILDLYSLQGWSKFLADFMMN